MGVVLFHQVFNPALGFKIFAIVAAGFIIEAFNNTAGFTVGMIAMTAQGQKPQMLTQLL